MSARVARTTKPNTATPWWGNSHSPGAAHQCGTCRFDKSIGDFYDTVGKKTNFNGTKVTQQQQQALIDDMASRSHTHTLLVLVWGVDKQLSKVLGMKYTDPDATMRDMGHALIRLGIVEDKSKGKVLSKAGSS